jgi:hypothetical protein
MSSCQPYLIKAGLPNFFSWYNIPKLGKTFQITIKYTKCQQNIPRARKIKQMASGIIHSVVKFDSIIR